MMSSTLGAPLGGTTRRRPVRLGILGAFLDHAAERIGGGGSCFPSIVMVALGEPGVPVICWAGAGRATNIAAAPLPVTR